MGRPADEELVRRVRAGDTQAAQVLYERYQPRLRSQARRMLRGIVRRRVGDSDVVQDAYVSAFRSLEEFEDRGEGSFARWLRRILRHKAIDTVRRHLGARKRGGGEEVSRGDARTADTVRSPLPTPSAEAVLHEEKARLRDAMASLPDAYRTVLEGVHRQGLTLAEVGEATGRSANAVCKVYGRAVRALAKTLREPTRA